jgi:hypothetical protein
MTETWQPIILSAKVFGHLSQGLYRTPAGAIKELISNSFDADAKLVRIHTDFPRFDSFSCEDNGEGMSREEFLRLMNAGIGNSYKRNNTRLFTELYQRPVIGRLGLGILALAQICPQFELVSHHRESKTAYRAVIKFPPYTREEMDKAARRKADGFVHGGQFQIADLKFDSEKRGVRIFTKYLRESFRKQMRNLSRFGNKAVLGKSGPYKTFDNYLNAIFDTRKHPKSLNLLSYYDQLLFGLSLAPPLPMVADRNLAANLPSVQKRQSELRDFNFKVLVDNLTLANPICLPSDRDGHTAKQSRVGPPQTKIFTLKDGPAREECPITQYTASIINSDETLNVYEFQYANKEVAGKPLRFSGYLFQQTGRLYPRDIQGVLIRLNNVAIGKYDNSILTYPLAEGPRYSMISSEIFIHDGFEDALNIDRDSFNELHAHYIRVQSYIHALLQEHIFPETWTEEKLRNKKRRVAAEERKDKRFTEGFRRTTGEEIRSIRRVDKAGAQKSERPSTGSPVEFIGDRGDVEVDQRHPLLQPLLRRKKNAGLIEKIAVAFERANAESSAAKRRDLFFRLLAEIFAD